MSNQPIDVNGMRIVATAPISDEAVEILEKIVPVEISPAPDVETMMGLLDRTVGIVCRGEGKVPKQIIDAAGDLRVIGRPGVGFDSVDVGAATARGIPLVYAPVGGFAVAEGALALLLALIKELPRSDQVVKSGNWVERYDFLPGDMTTHTLGIVGLGRIGAHLAKLVQGFDMTVLGYDPYMIQNDVEHLGVRMVELDDLLDKSDYVSTHLPLNDETRGIINADRVARIKKGAIYINTARGGIIESLDVLADGLESGQLSKVGLDVFPTEPPDVSHRIFRDPRCLCAPHSVGGSKLAMSRIFQSMANSMVSYLTGSQPEFCVNPETLG
jgi:D-3-phosphoglycerate dehydrogenase